MCACARSWSRAAHGTWRTRATIFHPLSLFLFLRPLLHEQVNTRFHSHTGSREASRRVRTTGRTKVRSRSRANLLDRLGDAFNRWEAAAIFASTFHRHAFSRVGPAIPTRLETLYFYLVNFESTTFVRENTEGRYAVRIEETKEKRVKEDRREIYRRIWESRRIRDAIRIKIPRNSLAREQAIERRKVTLVEDSGTCQKIRAPFSAGASRRMHICSKESRCVSRVLLSTRINERTHRCCIGAHVGQT